MPHPLASSLPALAAAICLSVATLSGAAPARDSDRPVPPPMKDVGPSAYDAAAKVKLPETKPIEEPGLHNVFKLSPNIVSGSEPHGESAFRELQAMGVKTILSVDGKAPNAELASQHGMRYVHVPIEYKGMTEREILEISKTFREQDGPFYVHCFHGKHRGPAAAAVGRMVLDGVSRENAIAEMRQWCGTSKSYDGLYRSVATAALPDADTTRRFEWDFPAERPIRGFRHAMVEVSRADDNLKTLAKNGWTADAEHPDADALNDAKKLARLFAMSAELGDVKSKPADFHRFLTESVAAAHELERSIADWRDRSGSRDAVEKGYVRVSKSCNDCHASYRDE
jgi:protein tyrosine phosphatase (PTP) superfamily phosphohydrolase (DUF442 family)/cytochrome c556